MPTDPMMRTIILDGNAYDTPRQLHDALQGMLNLPEYYGHNADALYDVLSERQEAVHAVVLSYGVGDVARALRACLCVVEDLGGTVTAP